MSQHNTIAGPLPVIDTNTIIPTMELVTLSLGDKPEKFDFTSFDIANSIINAIKEGTVEPLDFAVKKKLIADAMDIAMKDPEIKAIMIAEVEKYGKAGATALGAKISLTNRPVYQYDQDPNWRAIKESMKDQEEDLKAQEERIKAACKNGGSIVDSDSGEMVASIVPVKVTESIAVSFSKKKGA